MHRLRILALCVWLTMLASIGMAAWLWRSNDLRPHAAWAAISLLLVIGSTIWLSYATLASFARRETRCAACGWWLLGTTPILWFIAFATTLYIDANGRQPLVIDTPLRLAGAWACSFFDLEARLRYPRWTSGSQTILIDAGQTPAPELLVAQMEDHIASMTKLLGQPPLTTQVAWVRGSIFGMEGRAIGAWAICGAGSSADRLDSLDRHEVAHSVIGTLAGPDQDPPAALVEGWAESQSAVRDDQIRQLARQKREGNTYTLAELVAPQWYMRSDGPVYSHGGPLAHYLIERFGAPKFFELYRGVRRSTFTADCERILGISWDQLDAEFWNWIADQDEKLSIVVAAEVPKKWSLKFADGVSQQDWQTLVDACLAAKQSRQSLPQDVAIEVHWNWTRIDHKRSPEPIVNPSTLSADFDGDDFWIFTSEGSESCLMSTGDRCANLTRYRSGHIDGWVGGREARGRIAYEAGELIDMYRDAVGRSATSFLPISDEYVSPADYHIEQLVPPEGKDGVWKVVLHIDYKGGESNHYELTIDPSRDWQVTEYRCKGSPESHTHETANFERFGGVWFATSSNFEADYTAEQERVTSTASVRQMTNDERLALRQRVEKMSQLQPTRPWHRLRFVLTCLVVAWPAAGIALVAISRRYAVSSDATPTATSAPRIGPATGIQA